MSTEVKPGQVWRWNDSPGDPFTIETIKSGVARYRYRYAPGVYSTPAGEVPADATLVSLDVSKVAVGDIVTAHVTNGSVEYDVTGKVWAPDWDLTDRHVGPDSLVARGVVLTDHQPARN